MAKPAQKLPDPRPKIVERAEQRTEEYLSIRSVGIEPSVGYQIQLEHPSGDFHLVRFDGDSPVPVYINGIEGYASTDTSLVTCLNELALVMNRDHRGIFFRSEL